MLSIYICDDELTMRATLSKEIKRQILIGEYDMNIALACGTPEALLDAIRPDPKRAIYFLDVDLKQNDTEKNGFWLGKEIRKLDPTGFLIYVTSFEDLAFQTFRYHLEALDYIVKGDMLTMIPAIRTCLSTIAERLSKEHSDSSDAYFTVKLADSMRHIPLSDIVCLETSGRTHRILLYTEQERLDFIGRLSELSEKLGDKFLRCHRSFLVNTEKIASVDFKSNELTMTTGQVCLISRAAKAELKKRF